MARRLILVLLVLGATAAAVAPTAAIAAGQTTTREITLTATPHARTYPMPGRAQNITIVAAHENGHKFRFGIVTGDVATVYGGGVMLRFTQHGTRHYVKAVTLGGNAKVTITYREEG